MKRMTNTLLPAGCLYFVLLIIMETDKKSAMAKSKYRLFRRFLLRGIGSCIWWSETKPILLEMMAA